MISNGKEFSHSNYFFKLSLSLIASVAAFSISEAVIALFRIKIFFFG